jgi:CysZ protein
MTSSRFWAGASSLVSAAKQLLTSAELRRLAVVPVVVLVSLSVLGIVAVTAFGAPGVFHAVVNPESAAWYTQLGGAALAVVAWFVGCVLALVGSWLVTPVLCAPALEHLVRRVEQTLGAPPQPELSFIASLWCGLRAQLTALVVLGPLWFTLWLLGWLVPVLAPLVVPMRLLAVSIGLAWNLLDYPLTLRGVPIRQRLAFFRGHAPAVLGFGLAFTALFWVPLTAVILLPLGVTAATHLIWTLAANSDPTRNQLAPSSPRARHPQSHNPPHDV